MLPSPDLQNLLLELIHSGTAKRERASYVVFCTYNIYVLISLCHGLLTFMPLWQREPAKRTQSGGREQFRRNVWLGRRRRRWMC